MSPVDDWDRFTKRELIQRLRTIASTEPADDQRLFFRGQVVGSGPVTRVALEPGQGAPPTGARVMILILTDMPR